MSVAANGTNRRWGWAAAGAAGVASGVFWLFSLPKPPVPGKAPLAHASIGLQKLAPGSALTDEATLLDPRPLFLPTEWNATQKEIAPPEPGGTFQSYRFPAKPAFTELFLKLGRADMTGLAAKPVNGPKVQTAIDLPDPISVPPANALSPGVPEAMLMGFGRTERPIAALPTRGASVEIEATGTGASALSAQVMAQVQALAATAHPPGNRVWQAMEFVAAVDAAGLAAPLTMTTRSGADDVDAYFQNFLVRTLRIGERLSPGFYRISVGP